MIYVDLSEVLARLNTLITINSALMAFNCITAFVTVIGLLRVRKGVV